MTGVEHFATVAHRLIDQLRPKETDMTSATHTLVVTRTDGGLEYQLECPGVTDDCRMFEDCTCPDSAGFALGDSEGTAHGVKHRDIDGSWMAATDKCYLANADNLPDAVGEMRAWTSERLHLEPGRYPVTHTHVDETWFDLHLATVSAA